MIATTAATVVPVAPVAADTVAESKLVNIAAAIADGTGVVRPSASPNGTAPDLQLRVPSRLVDEVPADPSFAWLGQAGETRWSTVSLLDYDQTQDVAAFRLSTRSVREATLAAEDPNLHFSMTDVVGPGSFALYGLPESRDDGATGPDAPTESFRWGTGAQRDGSPQGLDATYALPARDMFNTGASFGASGMYCFDLGFTATLADGSPVGGVGTVRVAVGDTVAADAPCGTATGEVPGEAPEPDPDPEPDPEPEPGPEPDPEVHVITDGHIDAIAPQVDTDGSGERSLALRAHHDTLGLLDMDSFVLHSDDTARLTLPETFSAANDWSFVAEPGQTIWNSPYSQVPGLPWVGLSTQSSTLREATADDAGVAVRIDAVTGPGGTPAPGHFALDTGRAHNYGSEKNGAGLLANSKNGLPAGFLLPVGTHVHYNWFFDQPGVYCIAVTVMADLADGTSHTASEQLTHVVGETVDPATVRPCGTTGAYPVPDGRPSVPPAEPADDPVLVDGAFWDVSVDLDGADLGVDLLRSSSYRDGPAERLDLEDAIFRGALADDGSYWFGHDGGKFSYWSRDEVPYLRWNTLGVPREETTGDVTWTIDDIRGPGDLWVKQEKPRRTVFDTAAGLTTASLWPRTDTSNTSWAVTEPGKYCLDLTWSVPTREHGVVSTTRTLTVVADGGSFEHDGDTLTETCGDADGTPPVDDPPPVGPGTPDPDQDSDEDPDEDREFVLDHGHIDAFETTYDDTTERLRLSVKDDTRIHADRPVYRDPGDVTIAYQDARGRVELPESTGPWAFLGEHGGATAWIGSQTGGDQDYLPWAGWSTERLLPSLSGTGITPASGQPVSLVVDVTGPGDVFTFQNDSFGQPVNRYLDTTASDGGTIPVAANAHVHTNWVFTEPGDYHLEVTPRLRTSDGRTVTGPAVDYHVRVGERQAGGDGPGDPGSDPGGGSGGGPGGGRDGGGPGGSGDGPDAADGGDVAADDGAAAGAGSTGRPEQCRPEAVTRKVSTPVVGGVTSGHFDFGAIVKDGELVPRVKDDRQQPASWVDPASLTFRLDDAAAHEVPEGNEFAFLGEASSTIWSIGQVQEPGVPWLGWNTQHPSLNEAASGPVTFTLEDVSGPGELAVYATGTFGGVGTKNFGTVAGFPKSMTVPLNQHVHANWSFTEPGVHEVTIVQSVPLKAGGTASGKGTLRFSVGDTSGTTTKTDFVGRTASGEECDLTADQLDALASTGSNVVGLTVLAVVLVLTGAVLVVVARRRRDRWVRA